MGYSNRGVLVVLFYWAMFNNLDPGLAVVLSIKPEPYDAGTSDALISFRSTSREAFSNWTASLETFLQNYRTPGMNPHRIQNIFNCDYENPPPPGGVCDVDIRHWHPCSAENNFGYHRGTPCVFLKLDTAVGWTPEFYDDPDTLPDSMPSDLKDHIRHIAQTNRPQLNTVWVSCEGVYPADAEFIGPVSYFPTRGIPGYYFMNNGADGYLTPLVALHIERPFRGVLINIKCKAWARNIDNNAAQGVAQFGLMVD